MLKKARLSLDC